MILYDSGWIDRWANLFSVYISATEQIDEVMLLTALVVFSVLAQNRGSIDMPAIIRGSYLLEFMGQGLPHFFPGEDFLSFKHSEV